MKFQLNVVVLEVSKRENVSTDMIKVVEQCFVIPSEVLKKRRINIPSLEVKSKTKQYDLKLRIMRDASRLGLILLS